MVARFLLSFLMMIFGLFAFSQADTTTVDTNKVYFFVDEPAQYPGGDIELIKAVQKGIRINCKEEELISCKVMFKFIVERDGSVSNVIAKAWCEDMEKSGVELIRTFKFIPAKHKGVAVRVQYTLPLHIRLDR